MTNIIQDNSTNLNDNILTSDSDDVIVITVGSGPITPGLPGSDETNEGLIPSGIPTSIPGPAPVIEDQVIDGTSGDETLTGGEGNDTIRAGGGNDRVLGNGGKDVLHGESGNDVIGGGAGDDDIFGGSGHDKAYGGAGNDFLRGQDGNDALNGGEGADTLDGGNGRDTASYTSSDAGVQVALNIGSAAQSGGDAEGDILRNIENILGSAHDDVLTGNNGANKIVGGDGDDVIDAGTGRDTVDGGAGDDTVIVRDGLDRSYEGGDGYDTMRVLDRVGLRGDDEATGFEALEIVAAAGRNALLRVDADQMTFQEISFETQNGRSAFVEIFGDGETAVDLSQVALSGFDSADKFRFFGAAGDEAFTGTALADGILGRAGDDTLKGDGGDDFIEGGDGADLLFGGTGNDLLRGQNGQDDIRGGDGNDTLEGGKGADDISGGTGNDILRGGDGNDVLEGGKGADTLNGGNGRDTASYASSAKGVQVALNIGTAAQSGGDAEGDILASFENITGSAHDDVLTGNSAANVILGGNGNDVIDAGTGSDTVDGGAGDDILITRDGLNRSFIGGDGYDTLRVIDRAGFHGDDTMQSIEHLEIQAVAGRNALVRLDENQIDGLEAITFNSVNNRGVTVEIFAEHDITPNLTNLTLNGFVDGRDKFVFKGSNGGDLFEGSDLSDLINGADGPDYLRGNGGSDTINGGSGNDNIRGGEGADIIDGGNGRDTASYRGSDTGVQVALNIGTAAQSGGDAEGDILRSIENVTGTYYDDEITGNNGANEIDGGNGDDVIDSGLGRDTVRGDSGDDTVIVRDGAGRSFSGGDGYDTMRVLDRVGLRGDDEATGFEALEIVAAAGRNALLRVDADQMTFQEISFETQNGRSAFVEIFGDGETAVDLSQVALSGFDSADKFRFFGAAGDEAFTGTALADGILGRAGDDTLDGGDGDDYIHAGDGNDLLIGGAGADQLIGGNGTDRVDYSGSDAGIDIVLDNGDRRGDGGDAAGDRLSGIENVTATQFDDLLRGSNAANKIEAGAGDDVIYSLRGNDRLDGGAGNDLLSGGSGNDLLNGGVGNDILLGGAGADVFDFTERSGFGEDRVEDFQRGDLIRLLEEDGVTGFEDLEIVQRSEDLANGSVRTDTVIELENGTITLEGLDFTLQASDFDFI
ncbi:MAG: calcium-binding protein [Mangrovicoccus sp.]